MVKKLFRFEIISLFSRLLTLTLPAINRRGFLVHRRNLAKQSCADNDRGFVSRPACDGRKIFYRLVA